MRDGGASGTRPLCCWSCSPAWRRPMPAATGCGWARRVLLTRRLRGPRPMCRTSDVGASRKGRSGFGVSAIVVDPRSSANVYVAAGGRVFRSTDGGRSWSGGRQIDPAHRRVGGRSAAALDSLRRRRGRRVQERRRRAKLGPVRTRADAKEAWGPPRRRQCLLARGRPHRQQRRLCRCGYRRAATSASRSTVAGRGARSRHLRVSSVL